MNRHGDITDRGQTKRDWTYEGPIIMSNQELEVKKNSEEYKIIQTEHKSFLKKQ